MSEGTKTTPEAELLDTTIAIARNAPLRRDARASYAQIYWPLIEKLREQLDALGIEWRRPS